MDNVNFYLVPPEYINIFATFSKAIRTKFIEVNERKKKENIIFIKKVSSVLLVYEAKDKQYIAIIDANYLVSFAVVVTHLKVFVDHHILNL